MTRQTDLEHIIRDYEAIIRTSDRPEEKQRARRIIAEQWALVQGYLTEYRPLVKDRLPDEIAQIAARFTALEELGKVEQGIEMQDNLRGILPDDQIETTLTALQSKRQSIHAQLWGGGIIAQAGSAVNTGSSLAVAGNVYGGIHINQGALPAQPGASQSDASSPDPAAAQLAYLRRLQAVCNTLMLQYIDPKSFESDQVRRRVMELADVYTTLDTTTQVKKEDEKAEAKKGGRRGDVTRPDRETRPLAALEAAAGERLMVLLGDPGSGKSTFVKHLALCLAGELLQPEGGWLARLGDGWGHGPLFPLLVTLRDFARSPHCDGSVQGLWAFIAQDVGDFAPRLRRQLERDGGVLVLFDGLDEVADPAQRARVRDAVAAFAQTYSHPRNRYLVTCRVYAYLQRGNAGRFLFQLPEQFSVYTLAEFSEVRMNAFIAAWYQEVYHLGWKSPSEAKELAARLQEAVRRPGLQMLASRPLLLTVMALLHTTRGRLPDDRVKLYEETVELLLARWQEARLGQENGLSCMVNLDHLETALIKITYEAHLAQQDVPPGPVYTGDLADIAEQDLRRAFAQGCLDDDWNRAGDLIAYIRERAGLLVEREPGIYTFPHRTFQEYMAAAHLCTLPAFPQEAARLLRQNPAQWREVVMMAVGIMARIKKLPYISMYLVQELCPVDAPTAAEQRQMVSEADWRAAGQAGEALLEIGLAEATQANERMVARVRGWLAALLQTGALPAVERAAAGNVLAQVGDGRFREDAWFLPDEPLLGLVEIPAGPFLMGSDPKQDRYAQDREQPQHTVSLSTYYIARYPTTVAQFRRFVEQSGYQPRYPDRLRGIDNHPVVYVTWHDALAYCRWLEERLKTANGELRDAQGNVLAICHSQCAIRLPSEAEWEKAASWDVGANPGGRPRKRRYPWGDAPDPDKANYRETGIGSTSAVGCFPGGASPYSVLDMSGNMWEWTRSLWGKDYSEPDFKYPYDPADGRREDESAGDEVLRVLRGGAFDDDGNGVRCACRNGDYPSYRSGNGGFRIVVVSPSFPSGL